MRGYLRISGSIFGVLGLVHVVRLLRGWPVQVAGWIVPLWISWIAVLAAGALAFRAFRLLAGRGLSR
jgi:hypothetical protein